ncbi:hypothetical protein HDU80_000559 [Chytriomyces hyalinus]|nr:hypothetical protein HDU80_000559 [Chytriomyces hyalinus]
MEPSIGNMATSTPPPTQPAPVPINAPSSSRKRSRASFAEPATTVGDAVAEESLPTSARKKERTSASKVTFTAIGSSSSPQATNLKRKDRKKATNNGVVAVGSSAASPAGIESLQTSISVATFPASDSNLGDVPQSSTSVSNIVGDESDGRVSERTLSMDPSTQAGLSTTDFPKNAASEKSGAPSIDSPQIPQSLGLESNPSQLISSDNAQEPSGTSEATVWTLTKPSSDFAEPSSVSSAIPAKETNAEAQQFAVATSSIYIKTSSIPISSVLESPISNEPPTKIPEPIPALEYVPTRTDAVVETSTHISALLSHQSVDIPDSASRSYAPDEVRASALTVNNVTISVQPGNELSSKYAPEGGADIVMQESGVSSGEVEAGEIRESDQGQFIETHINSSDRQKSSEDASAVVTQTTNNGTNDMDIDEQPAITSTVETSSVAARRDTVPQELPFAENLDLKGGDNSGNQDHVGRGTSDFAPRSSTLASNESQLPVNVNLVAVDANRINGESTSESADLPVDTDVPSVPFATNETADHLAAVETDVPTREAGLTDADATAFSLDQSAAAFTPLVTASISNPPLVNYNSQDPNVGYSLEQRSEPSIPTAVLANDGGVNTLETSSSPPILMQAVSNPIFENTSGLNHTFATPDNAVLEKESSGSAHSEVAKNPDAGLASEDTTAVGFQAALQGEHLATSPAKPLADSFGAASISLLNPSKDELDGNSESSREPIPKKPSNPLDHVKVALQLIQKESVLLVGTAEALSTAQSPIIASTQSTYHSSLIDTEPVSMSDVMVAQPIAQEAELEEGEMAPTPSVVAPLAQQQFEAGTPQQVTGRSGRRGSVKGAKALVSALSSSSSAASLQADLSDGEVVATEEEALVDKKKCAYCQTSVTVECYAETRTL